MNVKQLEGVIEAILFTMGESVEVSKIAKAIEHDVDTTRKIIRNMMDKYKEEDRGIAIIELEDSDNIPQEMTGLIAMAVVSKYHKPCMIGRRNRKNEIQGSIRSDGNCWLCNRSFARLHLRTCGISNRYRKT